MDATNPSIEAKLGRKLIEDLNNCALMILLYIIETETFVLHKIRTHR